MTVTPPPIPSHPAPPTLVVESWADLLHRFDDLLFRGFLFRGQASHEWPLITSFNRYARGLSEADALWFEQQMILRFRSEAHLHLGASTMPPDPYRLEQLDTYLEWLMLMQHYGAPTRLLDWSYSPYVAVYFAVATEWGSDACLWYFDPAPVQQRIRERHGAPTDGNFDYVQLKASTVQALDGECVVYTAQKKMRTPREVAQQGVFTFTNRLLGRHQDALMDHCAPDQFGRMRIPRALKAEFLYRLVAMNVTPAALFPGVDGICQALRDQLRLRTYDPSA